MQLQKRMLSSLLAGLFFCLTAFAASEPNHGVVTLPTISGLPTVSQPAPQAQNVFRTPAKLYGGAYSIKLSIKRDKFEYELPVWVKPDQKESSLDKSLLHEMGWVYPDLRADQVLLSGEKMVVKNFKNQRSDWAGKPDFPKPCCYGVIGQDILKDYQLTFVPTAPAHIEWIRIENEVDQLKLKQDFLAKLRAIFSIRKQKVAIGSQKEDLSKATYTLDVSQGELIFQNDQNSSTPGR